MKRLFFDTGAWYALTDRWNPDHEPVAAALREHRDRLLTSNFALCDRLELSLCVAIDNNFRSFGLHCLP